MKDQITLTDVEYGNRKKTTKREKFLNKIGRDHPVESMGRNDQTVLSEGRAWATCSGYRDDAADVSDADMVQPVRRRDRGRHI